MDATAREVKRDSNACADGDGCRPNNANALSPSTSEFGSDQSTVRQGGARSSSDQAVTPSASTRIIDGDQGAERIPGRYSASSGFVGAPDEFRCSHLLFTMPIEMPIATLSVSHWIQPPPANKTTLYEYRTHPLSERYTNPLTRDDANALQYHHKNPAGFDPLPISDKGLPGMHGRASCLAPSRRLLTRSTSAPHGSAKEFSGSGR
ncbi:hypothetical protein B0H66DRAFT_529705 [Apodospora peruviana]|uniref:Uncharacterized protein n=1 Tax=Apodospora peruviana TaxID=516989 RepID=A0AAE0IIN0_9PEZI|nr:hypothetical protein B0H66DRAFT_529705 [Apodospora peruviana]